MISLTHFGEKVQHIFTTKSREFGKELGFDKRDRILNAGVFVPLVVLTWFEYPDAAYSQFSQNAATLGTPVSRQAIEQRFTPEAADTLKVVLEEVASVVVHTDAQVLPLLNRFNGVYVQDSSWITLPDECSDAWKGANAKNNIKKSALKLQLRFDVTTGIFEHFELTDGIVPDTTGEQQMETLPPGSLRLADLGYFSLATLEKLTVEKVHWITRLKAGCCLYDEENEPFSLQDWLKKQTGTTCEKQVFVGKTKRLKARLVVQKLSEQETQKRRREIRKRAKEKHTTPSKARLQLAGWEIYITNIDAEKLSIEEITVIVRVRWQIELMFKNFKSIGKVDKSRSNKPIRILCEVYAKLIASILRHWIMLCVGWKCLHHSIEKTATLITDFGKMILISFKKSVNDIWDTIDEIKRAFHSGFLIERRKDRCTTLELLEIQERKSLN